MSKQTREQWMQDIQASQRNIVFPDTAQNEARGWRNLMTGKRPMTVTQVIGIALIFATLAAAIRSMIYWRLRVSTASGTFGERLLQNFGDLAVLFVVFGGLFLLLRWRVRASVTKRHEKESAHRPVH